MDIFPKLTTAHDTIIVKRLFLCRHGETEANSSGKLQGSGIDINLNEKVFGVNKGIKQARALRDQLSNVEVDLFISSKLKRAKQTAEIVKESHPNTPLIEIEALAEISWGSWEGTTTPDVANLLSSWEDGNYKGFYNF